MKSYGVFADYYDLLTENVEYKNRADYLLEIFKRFNHCTGISLDLACGTGELTLELFKRGVDIYGIDASYEMLSKAQDKAYDSELSVMFLCQKMQNLDLYGTINTCVCTLDSLNHLTKESDLEKTFERIALFMEKDGLFVFDMNTVFKHQNVLADNTFVFDTDEVYCVWQNSLLKDNEISISLDFFVPDKDGYKRYSERFNEKAYSVDFIKSLLNKNDFELLSIYGDMTFDSPKEDEQRIVYVAKKIKNSQKI